MNKKLNGMVGLKARDTISESTVEKCSYQQINFRCYSRFDGTTYGDRAFTGTGVMGVWKLDTKKKELKQIMKSGTLIKHNIHSHILKMAISLFYSVVSPFDEIKANLMTSIHILHLDKSVSATLKLVL